MYYVFNIFKLPFKNKLKKRQVTLAWTSESDSLEQMILVMSTNSNSYIAHTF